MNNITLHKGDSSKVLKKYPDNHFDSIVTDPPYGIEFLGKDWDKNTGAIEVWQECLRVLKPGGHILAFSAARTYHRLATNLEDVGFEIRDQIMWIYGSGFPKGQDMGKLIEKRGNDGEEYKGWKTGLKPAHEPIVMARKPFKGSTVDNVIKHGTGAINIDDTRVEYEADAHVLKYDGYKNGSYQSIHKNPTSYSHGSTVSIDIQGRYPSNVIMSEEEGKVLDEKTSTGPSKKSKPTLREQDMNREDTTVSFQNGLDKNIAVSYNDGGSQAGGASKYYYCPKVSRKERNIGCEDLQPKETVQYNKGMEGKLRSDGTIIKEPIKQTNNHPTVKPVALMKYLVTLVTPKGGKVLDPFNGSGTTGMAVKEFGGEYVGIELNKEYINISKKRIKAW